MLKLFAVAGFALAVTTSARPHAAPKPAAPQPATASQSSARPTIPSAAPPLRAVWRAGRADLRSLPRCRLSRPPSRSRHVTMTDRRAPVTRVLGRRGA